MKKQTECSMLHAPCLISSRKGFTLIELLIVIAIIGILSGVVIVSMSSSIDKAKRASALTTLSSVLPEIVTCQDDGFGLNAYNVASTVCADVSHTVKWPGMGTTGYAASAAASTNANIATYTYTATKGADTINCVYANNSCT